MLLTASCDSANTGSQAVLRAVGMTEVGAREAPVRTFELASPG